MSIISSTHANELQDKHAAASKVRRQSGQLGQARLAHVEFRWRRGGHVNRVRYNTPVYRRLASLVRTSAIFVLIHAKYPPRIDHKYTRLILGSLLGLCCFLSQISRIQNSYFTYRLFGALRMFIFITFLISYKKMHVILQLLNETT